MLEVRRRADPATQNGHWEKGALAVTWTNQVLSSGRRSCHRPSGNRDCCRRVPSCSSRPNPRSHTRPRAVHFRAQCSSIGRFLQLWFICSVGTFDQTKRNSPQTVPTKLDPPRADVARLDRERNRSQARAFLAQHTRSSPMERRTMGSTTDKIKGFANDATGKLGVGKRRRR